MSTRWMKLEEVFHFIRNGVSIKQIDGASGYPITRIETIANGYVDKDKMGYADIEDIEKYKEYVLQDGDILMSHINSEKHLGKVAIYNADDRHIIHGMNLLALRAKKEVIFPQYAFYYFRSIFFRRQLPQITKKSVNQASFSVTDLRKLQVVVPDIPTQEKLVGVLNKCEKLLDMRRKQIQECDELIKSQFIEMFGTYPQNPKGWNTGIIRDVLNEVRYGSSRPAVPDGKYPYLRMNNITYSGELDLSDIKQINIPDNELAKCTVRRGDVLFNRTNSKELVGKTCVYNRDEMMVLAGFVVRVRVNEKVLPEFLSAFLNTDFSKTMLRNMCKAAIGQANINAQELQNIKLYIPPIELQKEFVEFKNQVDKLKFEMEQSLHELENNFSALMQKAFSGQLF